MAGDELTADRASEGHNSPPPDSIYLGASTKPEFIYLRLANRHGLISGVTGTGKSVTLQVLAEGFSDQGVPVFCADLKTDLSGLAAPGTSNPQLEARAKEIGFTNKYRGYPVIFWDPFGEQGHSIRTTVADMGPQFLSRLMNLCDEDEIALNVAFKIADVEKLPLLDLEDVQALLEDLAGRAHRPTTKYGDISKAFISIQQSLLVFEQQGGKHLFGETAFKVSSLMRVARDGRGYISILAADALLSSPRLYAVFLLFLLSELFDELPEVGDLDKPKLIFFFDEAHLLFNDAPRSLLQMVEQLLQRIGSKGVGVYFVTESPLEIPDRVSSELGHRVQHRVLILTRRQQIEAARGFRENPTFNTQQVAMELGVGEALVSTLDMRSQPTVVARTLIRPPSSHIGPITELERRAVIRSSPIAGECGQTVTRNYHYGL